MDFIQWLEKSCRPDCTAIFTLILAGATVSLAFSTRKMANEAHDSSVRQLGVHTWLSLKTSFDSIEILKARVKLATLMENYLNDTTIHDKITEEVLNLFEDIGTLYKLGLINVDLADSTFSFYATRWWRILIPYINEERKKYDDDKLFSDFEFFASEMATRHPEDREDAIDEKVLKQFLDDEKQLRTP